MQAVLISLAGCTGMDVVSILRKMRAPLEGLTMEVDAERATEHPKVFTKIHLRYRAWGAGLEDEPVRRAVDLSQEKYCSVSAMLKKSVPITYDVVVERADRRSEAA
jgi:putative redox protein